MSGRDSNDDIEELNRKVKRYEVQIEELNRRLQQLKSNLESSTNNIKKVEDEKNVLENKVNELELKIKRLEDDGQKKDDRIDSMEKNLTKALHRIDMIGKELGKFVEKSQDQEKDLKTYMAKTDELEKSRNILYIGQLCAKVMEGIYYEVIPVYFERDDYKQPHLKYINENIEQLYHNRREQTEAKRRWKKLQAEKIDADEYNVQKLVDFMEEMLADRNEVAHPSPLNEKELKDIASELPGQKQQLFQKVIEISKKMFPTLFVAF